MIAIAQMMISVFPISPFPIYLHSVARFIFLYGYIHIPFFCSKTSRATHCLQDKNLGCHSSLCLIVSLSSNITFYYHHCECSTPFRPISTFFLTHVMLFFMPLCTLLSGMPSGSLFHQSLSNLQGLFGIKFP